MKILALLTGLILSFSAHAADTSQLKLELLLAKRGDVSAQFRVATAYEFGTDIKKDLKQSFEWYLKAANQSHAPSQFKVGQFYEKGRGVSKNLDSAMIWYKKAKANGSNQASKRLNKSAYAKNEKAKRARNLALQEKLEKEEKSRKANNKKRSAKKSSQKATAKPVVRKTSTANIPDILKVVLNNKWKNQHGAADYLPSAATTCLESGDNELTCFSSEKNRKIKNTNITYTAKSTIVGFKSNGSFKVIYNYNGISSSGGDTRSSDIYGLTMKEGWQEPAIAVKCKATNRKSISCSRGSKTVKFRR